MQQENNQNDKEDSKKTLLYESEWIFSALDENNGRIVILDDDTDIRWFSLLGAGMPQDMQRIDAIFTADIYHEKYKDFAIHLRGVIAEPENLEKGEGFWRLSLIDSLGEPVLVHVWFAEMFLRGTKAYLLVHYNADSDPIYRKLTGLKRGPRFELSGHDPDDRESSIKLIENDLLLTDPKSILEAIEKNQRDQNGETPWKQEFQYHIESGKKLLTTVQGTDGIGGNFAFAWNVGPTLRLIHHIIQLQANGMLQQIEGFYKNKNLSLEEQNRLLGQARMALKGMVGKQYRFARNRLIIFGDKFKAALLEHINETEAALKLEFNKTSFIEGDLRINLVVDQKKVIQSIVKQQQVETKRRIGASGAGGSESNYDLTELPDHYQKLLPTWRAVMKEAKKDQKHPIYKNNWRERLSAYQFPDDLVEWLNLDFDEREQKLASHPFASYLKSRRERSKLADNTLYELSTAREISLEHAARLCKAAPYFYSTGHLKDLPSQRHLSGKSKK